MGHPTSDPRDFCVQKDTRNIIEVLREALFGADRVVVETRNALGEMDAHYLQAPELLEALNTHKKEASQ